MSEATMLIEAADRLLGSSIDAAAMRAAREGAWLGEAWETIVDMGLPLALVSEEAGGFGIAPADALALVRLTSRYALPLPLAETMLANQALGAAGLPLASGPAVLIDGGTLAITAQEGGWQIAGIAPRVPWGRDVATLVVADGTRAWRIDQGFVVAESATNLARMPRDTLAIDARCEQGGEAAGVSPLLAGAAVRSIQMAGALETVLALTLDHCADRVQFGRSLSKFQAVQHELARLGAEVAAAGAAADMAVEALAGDPVAATLPIAAARIRTAEAASVATAIAQQLHGAIGFTQEHKLHWYTTALWSWRDEYGGQRYWSDLLGRAALQAGGSGFWPLVTAAA